MTAHSPAVSRPIEWGPVVVVCECGWRSDEHPDTHAAFSAYEYHTRPASQSSWDRGQPAGYARWYAQIRGSV